MIMEWYVIVLIIVAVLQLILLIPLFFQARIYINVLSNLGAISLSIFGIPVICFQIELQKTGINIIRQKKEDKQITMDILDVGAIFANYFFQRVINWIFICNLSLFFGAGNNYDASKSAIYNGIFLVIANAVLSYLFTKRGGFPSFLGANIEEKDEFKIAGYMSVVIMPIVILMSLVVAWYRTKKVVKIYERILRQD